MTSLNTTYTNPARTTDTLPNVAREQSLKSTAEAPPPSESKDSKAQLNEAILVANHDASLQSKNQPLALIYKAALESINETLAPELGDNAIQQAYDSGLDVTPEATADRIVSQSTAFFSAFQEQNPGQSLEEQLDSFLETITSGLDQGFDEAKTILDGLGVLEGEIETNIDSTYELVLAGYDEFRRDTLGLESPATEG